MFFSFLPSHILLLILPAKLSHKPRAQGQLSDLPGPPSDSYQSAKMLRFGQVYGLKEDKYDKQKLTFLFYCTNHALA